MMTRNFRLEPRSKGFWRNEPGRVAATAAVVATATSTATTMLMILGLFQEGCGGGSGGGANQDTGLADSSWSGPDGTARDVETDGPASDHLVDLDAQSDGSVGDGSLDAGPAACPDDMVQVSEATCMDRYEAPNREGALPLVMYSFDEAASWCAFRGKRLCFDDEWTGACAGPQDWAYPYGDTLQPGVCNDDKAWRTYNQDLLNLWPWSLDTDQVDSLDELLNMVRAVSADAARAADHVEYLYQADPSGSHQGCVGGAGVFDLEGNVEEWTRRRDGGATDFHGNLKGRYWSEPRTCQSNVTVHADAFRFYEIGFRCCKDVAETQ